MFGVTFLTAPGRRDSSPDRAARAGVASASRRIALLRSGRRHGSLARLITPWDIGELTRPFVFLGYSEHAPGEQMLVGAQPGIGTLTLVLSGALAFKDAQGKKGIVAAGGAKWTAPGEAVWHAGGRATGEPLRAIQLWIEVSRSPASSAGESQWVTPHELQEEGPARVVLGRLGRACSPLVHAPRDINYLRVRLKDGQCWRYVAPDEHNVTWIAVDRGSLRSAQDGCVFREQIALFGDSPGVIEVQAEGDSCFVLGSARRLTQALVQGSRDLTDTTRAAFEPRNSETSVLGRRLARGKRR